jgi:hypothetical protein
MSLALRIYETFKDDEAKAKALSEIIDDLDRRIVPMEQISTKGDLEVTKLTLQKEIEQLRLTLQKEIEEVRLTLKKDIEEVRLTLQKEIEIVRKQIAEVKSGIIKWVIGLLLIQTGVIVAIITLLR